MPIVSRGYARSQCLSVYQRKTEGTTQFCGCHVVHIARVLGHYLLHISFSSHVRILFWDPLRWPLLYILPISRSVRVDAADLHVDLLLSELQNS